MGRHQAVSISILRLAAATVGHVMVLSHHMHEILIICLALTSSRPRATQPGKLTNQSSAGTFWREAVDKLKQRRGLPFHIV